MKRKIIHTALVLFSLGCLLVSCHGDDEVTTPIVDPVVEENSVSLTIYIDRDEATRAVPGDPDASQSSLPHVLMAYMARPVDGEPYDSIAYYVLDIGKDNWSEEPYYKTVDGVQMLLYRYLRTVNITMPTFNNVKLFCILASDTLDFLPGSHATVFPYVLPVADEIEVDSIENLVCDRSRIGSMSLFDIYSGWSALQTANDEIVCRIVASHVASKIDVIYNVADSLIAALPASTGNHDLRVTGLTLKNTAANGYFFKKRSNTLAAGKSFGDIELYNNIHRNGSSYYARFYDYIFLRDYSENNGSTLPMTFTLAAVDTLHSLNVTYTLPVSLPANRAADNDSVRLTEQSAYLRYDITVGGERSGTYTLTQAAIE